MTRLLSTRWFLLLLRLGVGGIFLYAGGEKLLHPLSFADSIAAYQIWPERVINLVALGLSPMEILLGILLVIGSKTRLAALGISMLLGIFTIALSQALLRGLPIDCGCFGSGAPAPWKLWLSLVRDLLLLGATLWLYFESKGGIQPKPEL